MLQTLKTFFPIAEKVWDRKTSLPILSHICVDNGFIRMTDLEINVKAPVDDKRAYTIPIKLLKKVLNTKPKELKIDLINDKEVKIFFDNKSVAFPFESVENYPQELKELYEETGAWTKDVLLKLYNQLPFTSTDELRLVLTGVYVHQNKKLSSCATDGHVLQNVTNLDATGECTMQNDVKVIMPVKTIQILAKFARGDVKVFSGKERMKFVLPGGIEITSNVIEGRYPEFRKVIPSTFPGKVTFARDDLVRVIKDTKPFANPHNNKAIFTVNNGTITINAENVDDETSFETSISSRKGNSKNLIIGLDITLLEKVLKGINSEQVIWKYGDSTDASVFVSANGEAENTINLLMPIKLRE
ncbi:hypothetical protein ACFL7D_02080 [candidate division KSB1 bacterium]